MNDGPLRFTRGEILDRLQSEAQAGKPILGAGASMGIVAKCAERAGADLLIAYSTGRSRFMGLPTTPLGDSNTLTLEMFDEIQNVVTATPIIGGIEAVDPRYLRLDRLIDAFQRRGYHGLINFPTIANYAERRAMREDVGLGFSREVSMVRLARERDFFTMVYAYSHDDAAAFADAGADVVVAHVGWTAGGLSGAAGSALTMEIALERVRQILDGALKANPAVIPLAHGGPLSAPEDTQLLYQQTQALGFVGASSIERIPVERAILDTVSEFKAVPRI
jgi:predicted TIM-barrel enzyme